MVIKKVNETQIDSQISTVCNSYEKIDSIKFQRNHFAEHGRNFEIVASIEGRLNNQEWKKIVGKTILLSICTLGFYLLFKQGQENLSTCLTHQRHFWLVCKKNEPNKAAIVAKVEKFAKIYLTQKDPLLKEPEKDDKELPLKDASEVTREPLNEDTSKAKELSEKEERPVENKEIIIQFDKESLQKQVKSLQSQKTIWKFFKPNLLSEWIEQIDNKLPAIKDFLSKTSDSGRISKNAKGNNTGFSFIKTNNSIFINIPQTIFEQGGEKKIKFAINLSKGELVGLMKNLGERNALAGDRLVQDRCPNNEYHLTFYRFEQYTKKNGSLGELAYVRLYHLGDASKLIQDWRKKPSIKDVVNYAFCIAKGIQALHLSKLTHNDIKLENIFLTDGLNIPLVLGDFGTVVDWKGLEEQLIKTEGSLSTMAPERLKDQDKLFDFEKHSKGDIYSFGATLYRLLTGKHLHFQDTSNTNQDQIKFALTQMVTQKDFDLAFRDFKEQSDIHSLCKSMLSLNPEDRPTIDEVVSTLSLIYYKTD